MYELLQRYGLWAVFFGTMIEGDLTLLLAGVLARAGVFSFWEAMLVGTAGGGVGVRDHPPEHHPPVGGRDSS